MKTVNFLEALAANNSSRVRLATGPLQEWFSVGDLHRLSKFNSELVVGQWIIEEIPMEIWVNVYADELVLHDSKEAALISAGKKCIRTARFVEVSDE